MVSRTHNSIISSSSVEVEKGPSTPFSQKTVHLTQEELIELTWGNNYWKSQHAKLKAQNEDLKEKLEQANAKIRDLNQRLYGKKSEKKTTQRDSLPATSPPPSTRSRGQQKGSQGHGRTPRPDLPVNDERYHVAPDDRKCSICGIEYNPLNKTEDSQIIEVEVKAHVRLIKRTKYAKACQCEDKLNPAIITAPPVPRLIPKSSIGISIWTEVLLNKFLFSRATNNLITDYSYRGLPIAQGTLTGGLKKMAPLFEPLIEQLIKQQLTESLFYNDETGWKVFEATEGKIGYRWYLWVFQSASVVYYIMAPTRSGDIPIDYYAELDKNLDLVIVVCDRYSGYKRLARENEIILLAFCWAHVRRDFLDAAKSWPEHQEWMFSWVEMIGELYALNALRRDQWDKALTLEEQSPAFEEQHQTLVQAVTHMSERYDRALKDEELHVSQRDVLKSLKNHWLGLTVFVEYPEVPMDNNTAERRMRNPGMGRKNDYGSGSQWSAELAAMMFSLFQTILLWKLNPHHWIQSYLSACAENGGVPPENLDPFIPWQMSEERKQQLTKPITVSAVDSPTPGASTQLQPP